MSEDLKIQVLEGANNNLDLAKLEDVLIRELVIPSYQRPYAWGLEDIEEIFETVKQNKDNICFFGSIILSKNTTTNTFGQERYYIIDGQQRLSSFLLIIRVILDGLETRFTNLQTSESPTEEEVEKKLNLKRKKEKLVEIIETVDLKRESNSDENFHKDEKSILYFIKNGGQYESLDNHLKEKIQKIQDKITEENGAQDNVLEFLEVLLWKVKFCLICITGKDSENFAINLFNTLNTTGQPLTAFEVLKSELHTIDIKLSEEIDKIQKDIIKKYVHQRKKIISHTGKLLLYLPLYRGDFDKGDTLSDKEFKHQRVYLKKILDKNTAGQIVSDITDIDSFYSSHWLKKNCDNFLKENEEKVCFQFLCDLKHDRTLPLFVKFYKNDTTNFGKCVKMCTAFSSLWRAFHDGGTSGIDNSYKDISLNLREAIIEGLNENLKTLFLKKLNLKKIEDVKQEWLKTMETSTVYKNQSLSQFLLFLAYNKIIFDGQNLKRGNGIDILNIYYWKHNDYKTKEHIIPQSERTIYTHTLGNLTLIPQELNSSVGKKSFLEKKREFKKFCSIENSDGYPYLPILKHIAAYDEFGEEQIKQRSKILSTFIWQTLAEDWLGWEN